MILSIGAVFTSRGDFLLKLDYHPPIKNHNSSFLCCVCILTHVLVPNANTNPYTQVMTIVTDHRGIVIARKRGEIGRGFGIAGGIRLQVSRLSRGQAIFSSQGRKACTFYLQSEGMQVWC